MFIRSFSVNIVGGLMDRLDTLGERYTTQQVHPEDDVVEFDFEEQSGLTEAVLFEAADYVSGFLDPEEKRQALERCIDQFKLYNPDEVKEFANMCGYMTLAKV